MKTVKKIVFLLVGLSLLTTIFGTLYMFNYALRAKDESRNKEESYAYLFRKDYLKGWIDSLQQQGALRDTFIYSDLKGEKIHALYIKAPQPTNKTAIAVHGYTDNAIRMLMIAHLYNKELGYNVLIPDLTGHGESEGEWISMGWFYRYEVMQWIDVALELFGEESQMVIHGISMGAATTMMTSGEELPENVRCFVADCGYTSVWEQFKYQLNQEFNLPAFPLMYTASKYCQYKLGWNFKEASALEQLKKCNLPMFFIHGDADTYVPTEMVYPLYEAKKGEKELWIVPGAGHANAYWDKTSEYVQRVKDFTDRYIR